MPSKWDRANQSEAFVAAFIVSFLRFAQGFHHLGEFFCGVWFGDRLVLARDPLHAPSAWVDHFNFGAAQAVGFGMFRAP